MMSGAVLRTLAVRISANTAQFRKDIDKVDRRFKRFSSGMRREAMMFQGQMAALGATVASGFGVAEVARAADEMVNLRNKMGATFDTTREVANGMLDIKRIAKESRSELDSVGTLYQRIAVSTKALGTSQEDVAKVTQVVANSFLMSGTTASEAANSARQFAQGLASGTLRGDEFRSVSENNVVLTQMLAEGLGMTVGQLRLFAQEGGLTAETIIPILTEKLEGTNTAVGKMALTLGQAKTLFRNAFVEMVDRLNQTFNLVPKVSQAIGVLAKNIHIVTLALAGMATLLLGRLLVGMVAFTISTLVGAVGALVTLGSTTFIVARLLGNVLLGVLTGNVGVLIKGFIPAMKAAGLAVWTFGKNTLTSVKAVFAMINPFRKVLLAIGAVIAVLKLMGVDFDTILSGVINIATGFGQIVRGVFEVMVSHIKLSFINLKTIAAEVLGSIATMLRKAGADGLADKIAGLVDKPTDQEFRAAQMQGTIGGNLIKAGGRTIADGATGQGPQTTVEETLTKVTDFISNILPVGSIGEFMETAPTKLGEFISTTSASMLEAIPGFNAFWAALRGDTDPDMAAAGPAPAKEDVQMSWAERWKLAIQEVKKEFGTLSMAVKGRVSSMVQSYATFDSVLQAGARSSKKIAALNTALALKEAIVMQGKALMNAWSSAPFPANLPMVAITAAQTGLVLRDIMKGQAHDGMDSLPSTGTYMLERGERVVSSRANRDLTTFLADRNNRPSTGAPLTLQINGVADPDLVFGALEQRRNELTDMIRSISDENLVAPSF
jgi:tape measure domain-containing protein